MTRADLMCVDQELLWCWIKPLRRNCAKTARPFIFYCKKKIVIHCGCEEAPSNVYGGRHECPASAGTWPNASQNGERLLHENSDFARPKHDVELRRSRTRYFHSRPHSADSSTAKIFGPLRRTRSRRAISSIDRRLHN